MNRYSIVGLGKLGASMAAAIAKRGFDVVGVDVNAAAAEAVNNGRAPVQETALEQTIADNRDRLRATLDHAEAVLNSDVTFVIVPTPSNHNGMFSLQYAKWAFQKIGGALARKADYHLVVLTSTVLPGSTRFGLLPILEESSGKKCGTDFGLCYSPEFIALGSVIHNFLNPDFTLVGEFDERSGATLEQCYAEILENGAPCKRMSLENAELTKVAVNTFVTTKISYANMLAELCESIPGGDIDVVSDALGADSRIGRKYLTGGLGYGGPCFPRDNIALSAFAKFMGVHASIAIATDEMNRTPVERLTRRIQSVSPVGATVAILGLAYKPDSHVVERSQGIDLALALAEAGMRVIGYDPLAEHSGREALRDKALVVDDLKSCLQQAEVVVVASPDTIFDSLGPDDFPRHNEPVIVFDCWRLLRHNLANAGHLRYFFIGVGSKDRAEALRKLWPTKN